MRAGTKHTDATRQKMAVSATERWRNPKPAREPKLKPKRVPKASLSITPKEQQWCLYCSAELHQGRNCTGKYCGTVCQLAYQEKNKMELVVQGKATKAAWVKRYLIANYGFKCQSASCIVSNYGKLLLIHYNGNKADLNLSNCALMCPNCISLRPRK